MKENKKEPTLFSSMEKIPPHDSNIEKMVVGSLIVEEDAIQRVSGFLKPEHFYDENLKLIYMAILALDKKGEKIDLYTITNQLSRENNLERIGGAYTLATLTEQVGSASHIEFHAKILIDNASRRALSKSMYEVYNDCFDKTLEIEEILTKADKAIVSITDNYASENGHTVKEILPSVIKSIENAASKGDGVSGLPTGFPSVDKMTGGWQNSDMIVIAARPAMGKTAFALSMAMKMAEMGIKCLFFTLEMSKIQIVRRLTAMMSRIPSNQIRAGSLNDFEWQHLDSFIPEIEKLPIIIDDESGLTTSSFRAKVRNAVKKHGIKIAFVDYIGLMKSSEKVQNREREIAEISWTIKSVAKELNIPIVALSQLNRAVEGRGGDKRPQLSDLRDSGSIEQDANVVCFIHRPEYYGIEVTENGEPTENLGQIIVAKQRDGATGDINLKYIKELTLFEEW